MKKLLLCSCLAGLPQFLGASLESGIIAFEARQWPQAMNDFLEVLQHDPANAEAHAYITLSSRRLEEDRQTMLRQERLGILAEAARLTPAAETLTDAVQDTTQAANAAQSGQWHARCEEARVQRLSGHLLPAHELVLRVLLENDAFPEAQRELSELQSHARRLLDQGAGVTIEERYALEGFYAYGQADYGSAVKAWSKLRTLIQQTYSAQETERRTRALRFAAFESVAQAHLAEDQKKEEMRILFDDGVALFQQKKWVSALESFRKLAIQEPEYPQLGHYLVRTEAALEKDRAQRLGQAKQQEMDELMKAGLAALERQSLSQAQELFERVLRMDPSYPLAHSYLTMTNAELKRLHDPRAAQMHYEAGLVAYASGKLDEAVREWRIAARMNPRHEKARLALGKVQKELAMHREMDLVDETLP